MSELYRCTTDFPWAYFARLYLPLPLIYKEINLPSELIGVIIFKSPPIAIFTSVSIAVAVAISISVSPEEGIKIWFLFENTSESFWVEVLL